MLKVLQSVLTEDIPGHVIAKYCKNVYIAPEYQK